MKKYICKILKNEQINKNVYNIILKMPKEFNIKSGQFLNIYIPTYLLPRPFSFIEFKNNEITIIYKVNGLGTKYLTSMKKNQFLTILGPLGNGFKTNISNKKILLIGGGVGLPPILNLYEILKQKNQVSLICAFTNKDDLFNLKQLQENKAIILVQNSNKYPNYNPISYLEHMEIDFEYVYACGPTKMLEAIDLKYQNTKKGQISIEERMGCSYGICYGCSKETKKGTNVLTCKNGPVFKLGELKW